jgi:hypothetical protein
MFRRLLLAGLLLRAAALPLAGTEDVQVWKTWSYGAVHGITSMYGLGGQPPVRGVVSWGEARTTVDYPPGTLAGLALAGYAYRLLDPSFADSRLLTAVIKLAIVAMDAVACWLLWVLAGRMAGESVARMAAIFYWLNPAVILDGAVLGYLDPWMLVPILAALIAASGGAAALCGTALAIGILIKLQAVFAVPVAALLLWHVSPRPIRASAVAAGTALVVLTVALLPFMLRGALPNVVQGVGSLLRQDMLSATAANLWWIVTWLLRASYAAPDLGEWTAWTMPVRILGIRRFMELGYPNPRPIGMALVAVAAAWGFYRARRVVTRGSSPVLLLAAGAFALHAYFLLAVQVHENHLFLALPLLAAAAASSVRYRAVAGAVSVAVALNLLLFYGIGRDLRALPRSATIIDATVLLSFAQVVVFMWHGRVLQVVTQCTPAAAPARR